MAEAIKYYTYKRRQQSSEFRNQSSARMWQLMAFHRRAGGRLVRFTEDNLRAAFKRIGLSVEGSVPGHPD